MRELKFRAWLEQDRLMCPVISIYCNGNVDVSIQDSGPFIKWPSQVKVMQWTGLLDKNGKEIYEGDVCAFVDTDGFRHQWPITWNSENATFWYGHLPVWSVFESGYYQPVDGRQPYPGEGFEIIGNVYENKELLK